MASQVERLSNGNYLFLVSTDNGRRCPSATCERCGETSVNATCPYYQFGGCNIGWLILDAEDPTVIVARADLPFVWAELPSETTGPPGFPVQSPYVTFTTGLEALGNDTFNIYFVSPSRVRSCMPLTGALLRRERETRTSAAHNSMWMCRDAAGRER